LVADLTNFQRLTVHAGRKKTTHSYTSKGHAEQIEDWLNFLRGDIIHPFPYPQARQSMEVTFAVLKSIQLGRSVDLP
jgi:hypothetical protein